MDSTIFGAAPARPFGCVEGAGRWGLGFLQMRGEETLDDLLGPISFYENDQAQKRGQAQFQFLC